MSTTPPRITMDPEPKKPKPGSVVSVVALANRLCAQKAAPGWHDLANLAAVMQEEADEDVQNFTGEKVAPSERAHELYQLNLRAQTVRAVFNEFFGRIEKFIGDAKGLPGFTQETGQEPVITERIAGSY